MHLETRRRLGLSLPRGFFDREGREGWRQQRAGRASSVLLETRSGRRLLPPPRLVGRETGMGERHGRRGDVRRERAGRPACCWRREIGSASRRPVAALIFCRGLCSGGIDQGPADTGASQNLRALYLRKINGGICVFFGERFFLREEGEFAMSE